MSQWRFFPKSSVACAERRPAAAALLMQATRLGGFVTDDAAASALKDMVFSGQIDMCWSSEIMEAPVCAGEISQDRVRGMLFGLAIGDALGNTTEGQLPEWRKSRFGEIRDYLPNWHANNSPVGLPSDDTQLAFWTLEHLLEFGHIRPQELAEVFASRQIFGIGKGTSDFVRDIRSGKSWLHASKRTAGNGALTRAATAIVPHLWTKSEAIWAEVALATAVTHNSPTAIGANVALASMFLQLLQFDRAPDQDWWVQEFVRMASKIEGQTRLRPRGGALVDEYEGSLWQFVERYVPEQSKATSLEAGNFWYSGAYLLETMPTVLHILSRHANDPTEAIIRAVNDTKDNDSVAAIVGSAVGALHGLEQLPIEWRSRLLGRTREHDNGRIGDLIDESFRRLDL
jgi:ADP-ribosyl-[dinitrogen reductase] hydrolase